MGKRLNLIEIVEQLEKCGFVDKIGHKLENNIAFVSLKEISENVKTIIPCPSVDETLEVPESTLSFSTTSPWDAEEHELIRVIDNSESHKLLRILDDKFGIPNRHTKEYINKTKKES